MHRAAVIIQARWRGVLARRSLALMREQRRKFIWAATVIQVYRSFVLYTDVGFTILEILGYVSRILGAV